VKLSVLANLSMKKLTTRKFLHRDEFNKDPDGFPDGLQWNYESSTGTIGLRTHIKNNHFELYKQLCSEHKVQPSPGVIGKLTITAEERPGGSRREPFNSETLLCYIWNFVVADDQVSFFSTNVF